MTLKTDFTFKNAFYKKKKVPAALRPAKKHGVLTFKTHFTPKNAFYKRKKKGPAALGPALKNEVLTDFQNIFQKHIS